jgi:glycine C-acetyltransferase
MVKDLFERIQNNKGPLGNGLTGRRIFCFPKLEGELDLECSLERSFELSLNDYLGLANHPGEKSRY